MQSPMKGRANTFWQSAEFSRTRGFTMRGFPLHGEFLFDSKREVHSPYVRNKTVPGRTGRLSRIRRHG